MTAHPNRSQGRIDVPLNVWPGPATTSEITTALATRLAEPGQSVTIIDTDIDPAALAAADRRTVWVSTSRRAVETALARVGSAPIAERSRLTLLYSPRAGLTETLTRYARRSRLTIAPTRLAAQPDLWAATVATLQLVGRLALLDAAGTAALPPTAATDHLAFQTHLVCAATEVYQRATEHAESLQDEIALPVALTRLHRDVALFCRIEDTGGAR